MTDDVVDRLARIESKIDRLLDDVSNHETRLASIERQGCTSGVYGRTTATDTTRDIETRVRTLEGWRWLVIGSSAVSAGTAASALLR